MDNIFIQLAAMLSMACAIGFVALRLKLPLVIAYLLTGVALSVYGIADSAVLHTLPEIGIAFVLFLIGMELNLGEIRAIGRPVILATLLQVIASSVVGFMVASALGFAGAEALILGVCLSFASTIVIVRFLSDHRDTASLYGKLSIGILLTEDLVAILALVALSGQIFAYGIGLELLAPLGLFAFKAGLLVLMAFLLSRYVLGYVFHSVATSLELLFLAAIAWCFAFTSFAVLAGFSVVIGAFIAGVALASSPYQIQIQGKVKPVRDFFVALFFIYIGSQVSIAGIGEHLPAILAFTGLALVLKPITYLLGLSLFTFRARTLFQTSVNLSQVSEFSLIIVLLAVEQGIASEAALSIIASAAVLSIIISSLLMNYVDPLYERLKPLLGHLQKKHVMEIVEDTAVPALAGHVVLIGADRMGRVIIEHLKRANIQCLILDYNPALVRGLRSHGYRALYGDASDPEILDHLQLETAHLVISTAPGLRDNLALLEACRKRGSKAQVVVRSAEAKEEPPLRAAGASYVILPERVSGDFLVSKLENEWPNLRFN